MFFPLPLRRCAAPIREKVRQELVDAGERGGALSGAPMPMVPLGVMIVVEHRRPLGPGEHAGQAVAKPLRVRGRPPHLPEDQFDEVLVTLDELFSAEEDGSHLWHTIPYYRPGGHRIP